MTLLYADRESVRVLIGRDELDVLPWTVADAPDAEATEPLPIPTFVAVAASARGEAGVLSAPSPSHMDEEELPYVGLLVGESLREAAVRAAWEAGANDVEAGEVLVGEVVPGLADRSERRVVVLAVARPRKGATRAMFYPPETLVRGKFNFAIQRVQAWLASQADAAPDAEAAPPDEEKQPPWVQCDHCENFICTIHGMHVHDCPCPPIEEWTTDPYSDPAPPPSDA